MPSPHHHYQKPQHPLLHPSFPYTLSNIMVSMLTPADHRALKENVALGPIPMKRERCSPEFGTGARTPANKKARTTGPKTNALEAGSTNLIFRKFVNNALNEKAAVGSLCILPFLREKLLLTVNNRGIRRISKCLERSSRRTRLMNLRHLPMNCK